MRKQECINSMPRFISFGNNVVTRFKLLHCQMRLQNIAKLKKEKLEKHLHGVDKLRQFFESTK